MAYSSRVSGLILYLVIKRNITVLVYFIHLGNAVVIANPIFPH